MDDLTRLMISDDRIKSASNNNLILTDKESHYLNKVMRLKQGQKIFVVNGNGLIWKAIIRKNNVIALPPYNEPNLSSERHQLLIGLAIALPKKGFEDILKISTEIGIDFIRPLYSDRQIKKISNLESKSSRWDLILNESVEQCERLWKPEIQGCINISEWIKSFNDKELISISITRENESLELRKWLNQKHSKLAKGNKIIWNVIGPEGGWSENELSLFKKYKMQLVSLSENILRTSTAAINASSILAEWRNEKLNLSGT